MTEPPGACTDRDCVVLHEDPSRPIHPPEYLPELAARAARLRRQALTLESRAIRLRQEAARVDRTADLARCRAVDSGGARCELGHHPDDPDAHWIDLEARS